MSCLGTPDTVQQRTSESSKNCWDPQGNGRHPDEVQVTVSRYPAASLGLRGPLSSTQPFESTHTSPTLCVTYRTELVSFSWH